MDTRHQVAVVWLIAVVVACALRSLGCAQSHDVREVERHVTMTLPDGGAEPTLAVARGVEAAPELDCVRVARATSEQSDGSPVRCAFEGACHIDDGHCSVDIECVDGIARGSLGCSVCVDTGCTVAERPAAGCADDVARLPPGWDTRCDAPSITVCWEYDGECETTISCADGRVAGSESCA